MDNISVEHIHSMPYIEFMAFLNEINRPPGGKFALRLAIQNSFIDRYSKVLDVGCNTGYCTFEIAHLTKCNVTGVDISNDMILAANQYRGQDPLHDLVNFQVADGMKLPFPDEVFDMTFSGGSTAFIENKHQALAEYIRVTKPWGFVTDINFFYHEEPPQELLTELNELLGIDIKPWGYDYWNNLYAACGLENHFRYSQPVALVSKNEIKHYIKTFAKERGVPAEIEMAIAERLRATMTLFNKNHKFLSWCVFVNRKRPFPEQSTLFE